jgi:hypothetical protein
MRTDTIWIETKHFLHVTVELDHPLHGPCCNLAVIFGHGISDLLAEWVMVLRRGCQRIHDSCSARSRGVDRCKDQTELLFRQVLNRKSSLLSAVVNQPLYHVIWLLPIRIVLLGFHSFAYKGLKTSHGPLFYVSQLLYCGQTRNQKGFQP